MKSILSLYRAHLPYQLRVRLHILRNKRTYQNIRDSREDHLFNMFDRHRCLFVHIPKTGGISIYRSLFASKEKNRPVQSIGHFTAENYEAIFGKTLFNEYFKFAFVRNPWSRVFSAYQFLKQGGFHLRDEVWAKTNLSKFSSFEDFVVEWINSRNIYNALHFIPQYEFLTSSDGKIRIDFIGKLENIESDFDRLKIILGIDCQLKYLNKTKSENRKTTIYKDFYTKNTQDIIARVYRRDIEAFNYKF